MFNLEKTLLLARAAFMHGYVKEAKSLYRETFKVTT